MGVKGFRTLDGSIEKYDYKYLENTPTNLSDFKNDIFGEQRDVFQELKESNFVYDETLSAYIIQIGTKLTWLIADNTVNNVLGYDLVRYNSSLGAYELITEQESPFVVENGVISFENFKIFNGLKPSTTGEYEEVDECWILCNDPNFGEEGYINLFKKYTKGILNMEQVSSLIKITIVIDNWTNNPNYATEDGQFYTDIPITGMTANHSASVIVKGTFENGFFPKAECIEGAIRIYAKLCPISEVMAVVEWGTGDGTAVITTENTDSYNKAEVDEKVSEINISLAQKSQSGHTHDDRYYTESEIDNKMSAINTSLSGKAPADHTHDDRYYMESEIDSKISDINISLAQKSQSGHTHDDRYYTEAETLSDSIKTALGLEQANTPNDAFSLIATLLSGASSIYKWTKSRYITSVESSLTTNLQTGEKSGTVNTAVEYSDEIYVNSSGNISLKNPSTYILQIATNVSNATNVLKGKYVVNSSSTNGINGAVYKLNEVKSRNANSILFTGYLVSATQESTTVQSSDRSAFPDSGEGDDGYTYTYLGEFAQASIPRIETGSYVGTGTYGSSNPNSLTFSFVPKLVIIMFDNLGYINSYIGIYVQGNSNMTARVDTKDYPNIVSWAGNTMSWYNTYSDWYQLNGSTYTYNYVAIG